MISFIGQPNRCEGTKEASKWFVKSDLDSMRRNGAILNKVSALSGVKNGQNAFDMGDMELFDMELHVKSFVLNMNKHEQL